MNKEAIMKKTLLLFILIFIYMNDSSSQDFHFSQHSNTPLLVNPANTGVFSGNQRTALYYRNQWAGVIQSPYKTFGFAFDSKAWKNQTEKGVLSLGLSVLKDKAGSFDLSLTQILLSGSFSQAISENSRFSGGIQGGMSQRTINFTEEVWEAIYDYQNNTGSSFYAGTNILNLEYTNIDLAGGILFSYSSSGDFQPTNEGVRLNLGAAFHHFNRPDKTFTLSFTEKNYSKFILHANGNIGLASGLFALSPSFLYARQGPNTEIVGGLGVRYMIREKTPNTGLMSESAITAGTHLRHLDSVIPYISLEFSGYSIGISYDVCISELAGSASGKARGIEINAGYIFPPPFRIK